jgi:hypothetical protein
MGSIHHQGVKRHSVNSHWMLARVQFTQPQPTSLLWQQPKTRVPKGDNAEQGSIRSVLMTSNPTHDQRGYYTSSCFTFSEKTTLWTPLSVTVVITPTLTTTHSHHLQHETHHSNPFPSRHRIHSILIRHHLAYRKANNHKRPSRMHNPLLRVLL